MLRSKLIFLLFWCAVALATLQANAEGKPTLSEEAKQKEAKSLFDEGKALGRKGDWLGSYDALVRSFELKPSHDTAANVAFSAHKAAKFAEAARYGSYALRKMPITVPDGTRRQVQRKFEESKKEVTTVSLGVDPSSAEIVIDGKSLGAASELGDGVFLDPGSHTIEARADGFEDTKESIAATRGGEKNIAWTLARRGSGAPAPLPGIGSHSTLEEPHDQTPSQPAKKNQRNVLPGAVIGGGVTLIAVGVGIGFLITANSKESDADSLRSELTGRGGCGSGANASDCAKLHDQYASADARHNISTAGFVIGGVAAAATLAYVVLFWPGESRTDVRSVRILPVVSVADRGLPSAGVVGNF